MESRFDKYMNDGKTMSMQIASINNFIDWNYQNGLDLIEEEINALQGLIKKGESNKMFPKKINQLIDLGKCIEQLYDSYHFNRSNSNNEN